MEGVFVLAALANLYRPSYPVHRGQCLLGKEIFKKTFPTCVAKCLALFNTSYQSAKDDDLTGLEENEEIKEAVSGGGPPHPRKSVLAVLGSSLHNRLQMQDLNQEYLAEEY